MAQEQRFSRSQAIFLTDLFHPPVHMSLLTLVLIFPPHKFFPEPYEILFQDFTCSIFDQYLSTSEPQFLRN